MRSIASSASLGANVVALAGMGLVGYGIMFLVRNFTGFIELGLTPAHVGGTPEQIKAFSLDLYEYISHLQVAVSAFIIALGVAVIALAWFGIRNGERWALWTAFITPVIGVAIALPLHFNLWHWHLRPLGADLSGCRDLVSRHSAVVQRPQVVTLKKQSDAPPWEG